MSDLDRYWPRRGPCWCCAGADDGRHRDLASIRARYAAGETVEGLAADYGVSVEAVIAAVVG